MTLPSDYLEYFRTDGPVEGALSVEPGWFALWSPEELGERNRECRVEEFAPGFLGFGSSGGGEMLAFDARRRVLMIPFVGMSVADAQLIADSRSDFLGKMEHPT